MATNDVQRAIAQASKKYGISEQVLSEIARIESGMNPNAKNPRSSAGGLFQFIDSTARQYDLSNDWQATLVPPMPVIVVQPVMTVMLAIINPSLAGPINGFVSIFVCLHDYFICSGLTALEIHCNESNQCASTSRDIAPELAK
jgi:hypothetical protein